MFSSSSSRSTQNDPLIGAEAKPSVAFKVGIGAIACVSVLALVCGIFAIAQHHSSGGGEAITNNYYYPSPSPTNKVLPDDGNQILVISSTPAPTSTDSAPLDYTFDFNTQHFPGYVSTEWGSIQPAFVDNWPATHQQAISQSLFRLLPGGANSPHHHPDAVEILTVFTGTIHVVRVEPNGGTVFNSTLGPLMSVIFPRGHVHFQANIGKTEAVYISSLNSERPGVSTLAQRTCALPYDILVSSFNVAAPSILQLCGGVSGSSGPPKNPIQYKPQI